jgi:hypothetical protein
MIAAAFVFDVPAALGGGLTKRDIRNGHAALLSQR